MGETNFNLSNNNIEQFNSKGDNVKIANNKGPVVVSDSDVIQTTGNDNEIKMAPKNKDYIGSAIYGWLLMAWKWSFGFFNK